MTPSSLIEEMLKSEERWQEFKEMIVKIMTTKKADKIGGKSPETAEEA